jgi:hypothetical protein
MHVGVVFCLGCFKLRNRMTSAEGWGPFVGTFAFAFVPLEEGEEGFLVVVGCDGFFWDFWLLAIQTARNHYALRAQRESQQMAQSDTTGEEGR